MESPSNIPTLDPLEAGPSFFDLVHSRTNKDEVAFRVRIPFRELTKDTRRTAIEEVMHG